MKASIICIGTELVTGRVVDTNSQYIAKELQQWGIHTTQTMQVEDHIKSITALLEAACRVSDYVILTGGLGPTADDLTKEAVADFTGKPLVLDEAVKNQIQTALEKIYQVCPVNNFRQAYFPVGAQLIPNHNGTAPGFIIGHGEAKIISLPGPPKELIPMFEDGVLPYLKGESQLCYLKKELSLFGSGESLLEDRLGDLMTVVGNPVLGIYASEEKISLVITTWDETEALCEARMAPVLEEARRRVGKYIFTEDNRNLEVLVTDLLAEKQLMLSVAESCTGGQLAAKITGLPGASRVFHSGYVTYSNQAKTAELGVPEETLAQYGAVSEETALAMVQGLKKKTNTDCCVSITGVAGPDGGTEEKPVGLVYIGVNVGEEYEVFQIRLRGNRRRIQNLTVNYALNFLRKKLEKK